MKKKIITFAGMVLAFLLLAYGFVPQVLGGKIVNQSDISGWQGMSHEMMEWNAAHPDDQTAWTESMFGGMPTTTIHASTKGDWTQPLYDLLLTGKRPATYLFISLLGAFLLMLSLGISPLLAAGGAVAVTFCAYNMQIIQVGHNTKMQAIAFLPWALAALIFTYRKALTFSSSEGQRPKGAGGALWLHSTFLGSALFGLAISFQVKANHPQITYYLALVIFIYALVMLVWMLRNSERRRALWKRFAVASALLLVMGCCGIGTNAIKLLPTYEYTPYSMRGGTTASADGTKESKGLDLDYATAWSYGWEELPNLFIPNYNGGASGGAVNPRKSETYALLKQAGQPNLREVAKSLPLYWGPQPFTAGPMYMGAVTIFLFIFGLMYYKGRRERWWILAATVLAVFLSLGSHFLWFTTLFYDYVPFYNKFRTVSMSLIVLQFTLPVLGFLMLDQIVRSGKDAAALRREVLTSGAVTAGLCLLLAVLQSLFGSFTGAVDAGQPDILADALSADRRQLLWADTWRSILLVICSGALLFWGVSVPASAKESFAGSPELRRRRRTTAAVLVCLLLLLDTFTVGRRYLNADHFVSPRNFHSQFEKRPVDEIILKDTDPSYRVLDLTVNVFNDSHPSYWHKNIGGYSPAKLQRYQEFIDASLIDEINSLYKALGSASTVSEAEDALPFCPGLASMNCRYIIVGEDNYPLTYRYARGNAWFVDAASGEAQSGPSAAGAGSPGEAFTRLSASEEESAPAGIILTDYAPNCLKYNYSAEKDSKVVFSEVYYPEGWTLTVDSEQEIPIEVYPGDSETPGGLLRCASVPAGSHTLEMRFQPQSYTIGEGVSRASSMVLILMVLLSVAGAVVFRKD